MAGTDDHDIIMAHRNSETMKNGQPIAARYDCDLARKPASVYTPYA
jgi:hypothetical protein